jgi:hypothetical protein
MISWITSERSGVRCADPASPTTSHGSGPQLIEAEVDGRDTTSAAEENVTGLSAAWPRISRLVASLRDSWVSNWT